MRSLFRCDWRPILVLIFIHHFAVTAVYLLRSKIPEGVVRNYVLSYMEPLFHQQWNMFAPEPLSFSSQLVVRCDASGEWIAPMEKMVRDMTELPWVHRQKNLFAYSSVVTALLNERLSLVGAGLCNEGSDSCARLYVESIQGTPAMASVEAIGRQLCPQALRPSYAIHIVHAKPFSLRPTDANENHELVGLSR